MTGSSGNVSKPGCLRGASAAGHSPGRALAARYCGQARLPCAGPGRLDPQQPGIALQPFGNRPVGHEPQPRARAVTVQQ